VSLHIGKDNEKTAPAASPRIRKKSYIIISEMRNILSGRNQKKSDCKRRDPSLELDDRSSRRLNDRLIADNFFSKYNNTVYFTNNSRLELFVK